MSARRGPRPTGDRLRRLLVMLPWLMERGEVPLAEMAARFGLTEAELVKDLELAAMCGLPPFVDEMIDVFIDEGTVFTGVPRLFTRPLRLTAPEGFALLAAAGVAMQMPGADADGALARALAKLAKVLGDVAVVVEGSAPPAAEDIAAAANEHARLRISYWSAGAAAPREREVTPRRVFVDRGHWYVIADDGRSGEERTFRVDRIESWQRTGVIDAPRDVDAPSSDEWFVDDELPTTRLRLAPSAGWVIERYPTLNVEKDGTGWIVELAVTDERWLAELLLRLGPGADVLAPAEWVGLGARAAEALLARYEATGNVGS
jgi:proteasome accessory factor C